VSKEGQETRVRASRYPEIHAMMDDPNASPEKVLRLIYAKVVTCLREIESAEVMDSGPITCWTIAMFLAVVF
jgi:hypothetical protein